MLVYLEKELEKLIVRYNKACADILYRKSELAKAQNALAQIEEHLNTVSSNIVLLKSLIEKYKLMEKQEPEESKELEHIKTLNMSEAVAEEV